MCFDATAKTFKTFCMFIIIKCYEIFCNLCNRFPSCSWCSLNHHALVFNPIFFSSDRFAVNRYAFMLPQFSRQRFSRQLNSRKAHNCKRVVCLRMFINIYFNLFFLAISKRHLTSHETAILSCAFLLSIPSCALNWALGFSKLKMSCTIIMPFIIR